MWGFSWVHACHIDGHIIIPVDHSVLANAGVVLVEGPGCDMLCFGLYEQ